MKNSFDPLKSYFHTVEQMKHQPFHLICKPAGADCNLDCQYCFYLSKKRLLHQKGSFSRMSEESLKLFIRQYILRQPPQCKSVHFVWQGGEPTLMGLDFFRKAIFYQQEFTTSQREITNSFQTNGILIDDEWARFFADNHFLVGISIDGPEAFHNRYRTFANGKGSFSYVIKAIETLQKHQVEFNTLTCVQNDNGNYPVEIYRFLKEIGSHYMQFIPIVEPQIENQAVRGIAPDQEKVRKATYRSVQPKQWGQFLLSIFEEWIQKDIGDFFVQFFDTILALVYGLPASLCAFQPVCGKAMVVEHNGDLYSCDHFVFPKNKLGNIHQKDLGIMIHSDQQLLFGIDKHRKRSDSCKACDWNSLCFGECPANRIVAENGEFPSNYLCAGYKYFFQATIDRFQAMAKALKAGDEAKDYQKFLSFF